jgi:hypothetical protein
MSSLSLNDLIAVGIIGLAIVVMALSWLTNRKPHSELYGNVAAYDAIEALMHRSSEEGEALLIGMGEGFSGQNPGLGDSVGLLIDQIVLSRSVFNDQPTRSFSGDGALACISQLVVHGAYENAMASELFRSEHSELSGVSAFAWMAGLMPELARKDNAGLILSGTMRPEHILIADLADRKDLPLVVATGSLAAQAAFFASSSVFTLGEDYYLPSIGKVNQRAYQNQAKTMNWLRVILAITLIAAALLKLSGVLP